MNKALFATLALGAAVAFAGSASAEKLKATLDGKSEVPATTSSGTGTADLDYDAATKKLSWKVTYSGLSGPATAAHFHGPAETGKNAGVAVPIPGAQQPGRRLGDADRRAGRRSPRRQALRQHSHRGQPGRRNPRPGDQVSFIAIVSAKAGREKRPAFSIPAEASGETLAHGDLVAPEDHLGIVVPGEKRVDGRRDALGIRVFRLPGVVVHQHHAALAQQAPGPEAIDHHIVALMAAVDIDEIEHRILFAQAAERLDRGADDLAQPRAIAGEVAIETAGIFIIEEIDAGQMGVGEEFEPEQRGPPFLGADPSTLLVVSRISANSALQATVRAAT